MQQTTIVAETSSEHHLFRSFSHPLCDWSPNMLAMLALNQEITFVCPPIYNHYILRPTGIVPSSQQLDFFSTCLLAIRPISMSHWGILLELIEIPASKSFIRALLLFLRSFSLSQISKAPSLWSSSFYVHICMFSWVLVILFWTLAWQALMEKVGSPLPTLRSLAVTSSPHFDFVNCLMSVLWIVCQVLLKLW